MTFQTLTGLKWLSVGSVSIMKYLLYVDYEYYGAYVNEQDAIDDGERLDPNGYWIEEQDA